MGYVHLLLEEQLGPVTGEQRHAIQGIGKSLGRMKLLIENLLDATALQLGRIPIHPQSFEARPFLVEVSARLEEAIRSKEIDVHVEALPAKTTKIMTDRDKLGRVVYHLLDNAIKFTNHGGVVKVSIKKDSKGYLLQVLDSGEGIPEDDLEKIFEPFYQIDGSVTRSYGGMGIGLAIVRRLVSALEGTVHVESPPVSQKMEGRERGTLVVVRLPKSIAPVQGSN
jgi:signal transduction histidine kinase